MRCSLAVYCLMLASLGAGSWAWPAPPAPASPPAPARPAPPAAPAPSAADNEAAAKHAKRTACLSQARTKKLVGAQKNAFVKDCIGQP
jgi:hypothetical protein